ncbi:MAG: non-reducing end alpha-L-arabinofuranosidase family hydrolase [Verrucomicrobiales bacterium]
MPERSAIEYCSFENWDDANASARTLLTVSDSDYFCAPQVFYFKPHEKWYLIYQVGIPDSKMKWVAYSTTTNIDDPTSWTKAQPMPGLDGGPDDPRKVGGLDYWVICDEERAYLFLTSLNGKMWRLSTAIGDFPTGFGDWQLALDAKIFEASHTYKLKGMDKYLTFIEEDGRRYFKAYIADRLDGEWKPLADTEERPFAGANNIRPKSGVDPWTDNVSHGELVRDSNDQRLVVDPDNLQLLFQGMLHKDKSGRSYSQYNWRLGLLTPIKSEDKRPPVSWVNPQLPEGPGLQHHVLKSKAMGHDIGYVVATPADYDASGKTRYPVVYFLHGMGGNESADAGGFSGLVRGATRAGKMPPAICVFPNGGRSGYRGNVENMIVEELIPLIDQTYPTKESASSRVVAGFSMGGAGSVRLSLLHPELFCGAASWGGGIRKGSDDLLAATEHLKNKNFSFLLVNGDKDRPDAYNELTVKLAALGVPHKVTVLKDTPHNLGLYYKLGGDEMVEFLGKQLLGNRQAAIPREPVMSEESWAIATMPDLGDHSGPDPKKQHVVDHGFIRDAHGKWQLWACIRGTSVSRLLFGWQGDSLTLGPWEPKGVVMRANPDVGENVNGRVEGIGAPYFIRDTSLAVYR